MELAKILKELCDERGITISTLSKRSTVPQQTLHNWLSGVEPKNLTQVKKVADFFEVSLDYLCFGKEAKKPDDITSYRDEINAGVFPREGFASVEVASNNACLSILHILARHHAAPILYYLGLPYKKHAVM